MLAGALGSTISAFAVAAALGQPADIVRTPGLPDVAIPATELTDPPAVSAQDFGPAATGSVEKPSTPPALETALPPPTQPALVDAAREIDPAAEAVAALLANDGAAARLRYAARDGATIATFYAARQNALVWVEDGRFSSKAEGARSRIAAADGDALDPRRYPLPDLAIGSSAEDAARADIALTAAALAYAREAWGGQVAPRTVSTYITAAPPAFDAAAALATITQAADVTAALDAFNPPHPQFQALRKLLAAKRAEQGVAASHAEILAGPLLAPGASDPRVPALRARLGVSGAPDDMTYDEALADAVSAFQKSQKIGASGLVNRETLRALNAPRRRDPSALIALNMERWRWLPRDLGAKHVFVDIAAQEVHVVENGASVHDTRVIVGKPQNQTPIFSSAIDHLVVNPYWNVPASITVNEMLPRLQRDPGYLTRTGYEVIVTDGKKTQVVSSASINWSGGAPRNVRIRQPPGERNALGNIKFMFPNDHAVYLHDTPNRSLFKQSARALSHGCVRVDDPMAFADALAGDQDLGGDRLKKMVGGKERRLNLATTIPVHLAYFTAWVDADGVMAARPDIYGHDQRLQAALNGERLVSDAPKPPKKVAARPAVERPRAAAPRPAQAQAAAEPRTTASAASQQPSWLSRLFGDSRN